jgi:regulator of protease activity HflC (stomatin/prohibitin superfamily)
MNPFKRKPGYLYDDGLGILIAVVVGGFLIYYIFQLAINNMGITLLILAIIYGLLGIKNIPVGHKGLVLSLGKRTNQILDEGINWQPAFINRIEIVDCRERFINGTNMRLNLANFIPATIMVSAYYKIDNLYNYFENYDKKNFASKVNSDIMRNLREFLIHDEINERELLNVKSVKYRNTQISEINADYLYRLGIKVTNITIESIHLDNDMASFYTMLRQADVLALERNLDYSDALKTSLVMNNKIGNNYNNINVNSDTLVDGLKQLKRLKLLANE